MERCSHISAVVLFCSSPACPNLSFDSTKIFYLFLFISTICRQRCPVQRGWFEWGSEAQALKRRLQKRRCHRKDILCGSGDEPLSGRVFLSLLGSIPVVQESQVNILASVLPLISLRPIRGGGHMLKTIFIHKLLVFIADKLRTIVCY